MSNWQGTGTKISKTHKTFGDLIKEVTRRRKDSSVTEIRYTYNEFLREHEFKQIKIIKREISLSAFSGAFDEAFGTAVNLDEISIDDDIINIKSVYLNDKRITWMSYEDYAENNDTDGTTYTILDRILYLSKNLGDDDEVFFKCSVQLSEQGDIDTSDELDINNTWFNIAVNYILKELYQSPGNYDQYQAKRYIDKYMRGLDKAASNVLAEEGFRSSFFDDIDLDYGWED